MRFIDLIKKNFVIILSVTFLYLAYVSVFIKPWNFKYFSLVDDGQVLIQSSNYFEDCAFRLRCGKFLDQTFEYGTTRFRPSYWLINNINYEFFKTDATLHHQYRVYAIGLASVLILTLILLDLGINWTVILTSVLLFFTTYSFSENIIRLGTNEPYQVLFLGLFSFLYLRNKNLKSIQPLIFLALVGLLVWALLIKENDLAILPTIFFTELIFTRKIIFNRKFWVMITVPFLIFVIGAIGTKYLRSTISGDIPIYASNYSANPFVILENTVYTITLLFNTISPFLKIGLLLLPFLFLSTYTRVLFKQRKLVYWLMFSTFFVAILFPWKYVLDRYQLVGIFGLTIVLAFIFNAVVIFLKNMIKLSNARYVTLFNLIYLFLLINLFFRGFPVNLARTVNYANWFSTFTTFEHDQVNIISKDNYSEVLINAVNNLNDWEFLYELPIHLKYLYGLDRDIALYSGAKTEGGYLLSRTALDPYLDLSTIAQTNPNLIESKTYTIDQIDPIAFRNKFIMKPVKTALAPPLLKEGFTYYWEIRQIKE